MYTGMQEKKILQKFITCFIKNIVVLYGDTMLNMKFNPLPFLKMVPSTMYPTTLFLNVVNVNVKWVKTTAGPIFMLPCKFCVQFLIMNISECGIHYPTRRIHNYIIKN
jgi:hypothetical protein